MKKRKFLVPLAVSVAALVGSTEGGANTSVPPLIPTEAHASAVGQLAIISIDDFVIQRSDVQMFQTAGHVSHVSHVSHASHASHASHRSSGW